MSKRNDTLSEAENQKDVGRFPW